MDPKPKIECYCERFYGQNSLVGEWAMSFDPRTMTPEQYLKLSKKASNTCKRCSDVPHVPESHPQEMRYLVDKLNAPDIPNHLKPQKEWTSNLMRWFAHVRQTVVSSNERDLPGWMSVLRDIESQELPSTSSLNSQDHAASVLIYFDKRGRNLTKTDLHWIFASLTVIDKLLTPDMCVTMQNVKTMILKQLLNANQNEQSYMIVLITLISKYFGQ